LVITSAAALCAIWVFYPLAIMTLAALRRSGVASRPRPRDGSGAIGAAPSVTVVIATRDEAEVVRRRVDNALASRYAGLLDVVVALDAGASAATAAALAALDPRVTVLRGDPPGGKAAALNAGVRAATGDVLVFGDAHQFFEPDAVARLVDSFADPRVGAASGCLEVGAHGGPPTLADRYWWYEKRLRHAEARLHSAVGVTGAIYAMRRELWTPLPVGLILDDVYAPMSLVLRGYRVDFVEAAKAVEARRFEVDQEYRRKVRTLTGNIQLCAWLPAILVPVRNPIWLQFVCHKLLRLLTPYLALALTLGALALAARALGDRLPAALLGAALAGAVLLAARPGLRRRARGLLEWGLALQVATVVATINGLRGRWDVWRR
jgi:cellulose synthase/poly-beta-1,6-N-acetylglucosamine synthase-like glycosyltransferase